MQEGPSLDLTPKEAARSCWAWPERTDMMGGGGGGGAAATTRRARWLRARELVLPPLDAYVYYS